MLHDQVKDFSSFINRIDDITWPLLLDSTTDVKSVTEPKG